MIYGNTKWISKNMPEREMVDQPGQDVCMIICSNTVVAVCNSLRDFQNACPTVLVGFWRNFRFVTIANANVD